MTITSITSIEVEAFKAFVTPTALRLSDLPPGLHLVRGINRANTRLGSNGAGKSTLFSDAVTWCLYGRTVGGLRTTDVQSWLTEEPPRVAVGVRCGDLAHVVQRGPRASALTLDGRAVGQPDIDSLIGLDCAAWCQAAVWGQGQPLFLDLAPRDKMQLLSDALGLERWERRAAAAGARARRLEDRAAGVAGEVRGLESAREHARSALEAARDASERWGRGQAAQIEETAQTLSSARMLAASLEEKRGEASLAADSAGTAAKMLRPSVEASRKELAELQQTQRDHRRAREQCAADLRSTTANLESFSARGRCPTCDQPIKKEGADKHIPELTARVKILTRQHASGEKQEAIEDKEVGCLAGILPANEARLSELESAAERAVGELRLLEREHAVAQAHAAMAEEACHRVENEVNPHRQVAANARTRLREIEKGLGEKRTLAEKLAASVERAQFWTRGFRDIRLGAIDDVLEDLRETVAAVLEALGVGDWGVEFMTERETRAGTTQRALSVAIRAPGAPEGVRWETYSGGERQRLRLAGALALAEVLLAHAGASLDFRVLDEPTRGLSREGVRDLTEALATYAEEAGLRLFYADHQSEEGLSFTSTTTVINDVDGARITAGPN